MTETNQDNQQYTESDKAEITEYLGLNLAECSKQIKDEYKVAEKFIRSRREAWRKFLKLYINQRKNTTESRVVYPTVLP